MSKNPLYVVKGKQVEQASNWFDLFVKKFDLEPVVAFLQQMLSILLAQINSYPLFLVIKEYVDKFMAQIEGLFGKFAKA